MGRPKKSKYEYNDFLDGEKLTDNAKVRTSLQTPSSAERRVSPPPMNVKRTEDKGTSKGERKPPLTHFLCLPLVTEESRPQLESALEQFRREIEDHSIVPVKSVRPIGTLHLTLGVMSLNSKTLEKAAKALEDLDIQSILPQTVSVSHGTTEQPRQVHLKRGLDISLKSLIPMQSPHKTSILYAEPSDSENRLYPFAQALKEYFTTKGFLVPDERPLRLHATILNTIYARPSGRHSKNQREKNMGKIWEMNIRRVDKFEKESKISDAEIDASITAEEERTMPEESSFSPEETSTAPIYPTISEPEAKEEDKKGTDRHGTHAKSWLRFDGRELIEKYLNFVWAKDVSVDRVQICKMGTRKILDEQGEVKEEKYEVVFEKSLE